MKHEATRATGQKGNDMNRIALIAAAGMLTAITTPAQAAEMPTSVSSPVSITLAASSALTDGDPPRHARAYGRRDRDRDRDYRDDWDDDDYRDRRRGNRYDRNGRYREPPRLSRRDRVWRGRDGRYYCKRDNGTTGLVIGAGLGALAGRTVDTRGDRTLGTVLGAIAGGLLGREIDRGEVRCR